jgi:hypothetical protein
MRGANNLHKELLEAYVEELLAMLRRLEWVRLDDESDDTYCVICGSTFGIHSRDCELADLLGSATF